METLIPYKQEIKNKFIHTLDLCFDNIKHKRHIHDNKLISIFINGLNGIGKTRFVETTLQEHNIEIIHIESFNLKKKYIDSQLLSSSISNKNVYAMLHKKTENRKVVVIDNVENIYATMKTLLTHIIHLIRPKRIKSNKKECTVNIPVILIGNIKNLKS